MAEDKALGIISVEWDNDGKLVALEVGLGLLVFLMLVTSFAIFHNIIFFLLNSSSVNSSTVPSGCFIL